MTFAKIARALLSAALMTVPFVAASAACNFELYPETCNENKCCGRACCTKEHDWCSTEPPPSPPPSGPHRCATDWDCDAEWEVCRAGACEARTAACATNADCPAGEACVAGLTFHPACTRICSQASDCPAGYACTDGHCVAQRCAVDTACPNGSACIGYSLCASHCPAATTCGAGEVCVGNACLLDHTPIGAADAGTDG